MRWNFRCGLASTTGTRIPISSIRNSRRIHLPSLIIAGSRLSHPRTLAPYPHRSITLPGDAQGITQGFPHHLQTHLIPQEGKENLNVGEMSTTRSLITPDHHNQTGKQRRPEKEIFREGPHQRASNQTNPNHILWRMHGEDIHSCTTKNSYYCCCYFCFLVHTRNLMEEEKEEERK
jgi:hypothetical protein